MTHQHVGGGGAFLARQWHPHQPLVAPSRPLSVEANAALVEPPAGLAPLRRAAGAVLFVVVRVHGAEGRVVVVGEDVAGRAGGAGGREGGREREGGGEGEGEGEGEGKGKREKGEGGRGKRGKGKGKEKDAGE